MNTGKPKTTIQNPRLHWTVLSFLLTIACVSIGHSDQRRLGISHRHAVIPSQVQEAARESFHIASTAAADLHAGRYALSENEAREALAIDATNGVADEVLAAALDAQDKDQEALRAYQMVVEHYDRNSRNLLPYAQLLLKSGQWAQAVTVYNQTLPTMGDDELKKETSGFSPEVPEPAALATAIHLERGYLYNAASDWAGEPQNTEAITEYAKALQIAPDNALANYYYGVGWHKLSPAERVKFGHAAEAKAALQKAALTGNGDVKRMAEETLKKAK